MPLPKGPLGPLGPLKKSHRSGPKGPLGPLGPSKKSLRSGSHARNPPFFSLTHMLRIPGLPSATRHLLPLGLMAPKRGVAGGPRSMGPYAPTWPNHVRGRAGVEPPPKGVEFIALGSWPRTGERTHTMYAAPPDPKGKIPKWSERPNQWTPLSSTIGQGRRG